MTRANEGLASFIEAIRESPAPAAAQAIPIEAYEQYLRSLMRAGVPAPPSGSAEGVSTTSLPFSVLTALRILDTLKNRPQGLEPSKLMKETSADFVEFGLALQSLEKLSAVVVDRQSDTQIATLGPAWQDVRPLLTASLSPVASP